MIVYHQTSGAFFALAFAGFTVFAVAGLMVFALAPAAGLLAAFAVAGFVVFALTLLVFGFAVGS